MRLSSGEVVDLEVGRGVLSETDGTVIKRDEQGGLRYGDEGKSEVTKAERGKKELIYNVLEVETGGEYYIELSDGTGVWLGACSRLRYPVRFGEGERVLWLEGEAFFEVARDEGRPFTVYAGDLAVEALGTSFNVKSYADDDFSHATLRSGRVRVTVGKDGSGGEVVLEPGEQALWEGGRMTRREVNVEVYTAWMGDAFCFERERLEDIMKSVARWYGVEVFFTSEELKGYHFGGRVPKYADVGEALGLLELTTDVRFEVKGRTVTVTRGDRGGGD